MMVTMLVSVVLRDPQNGISVRDDACIQFVRMFAQGFGVTQQVRGDQKRQQAIGWLEIMPLPGNMHFQRRQQPALELIVKRQRFFFPDDDLRRVTGKPDLLRPAFN